MPVTITLTPTTRNRIELRATRGADLVMLETFTPTSAKQRDTVALNLGVDKTWLLQRCDEATQRKDPSTFEYTPPEPVVEPLLICLRGMRQPISEGRVFSGPPADVICQALTEPTVGMADPVVEWKDDTVACFLDVDYHHVKPEDRPSSTRLEFLMSRIQPQPVLWFESRNQGVKALYVKSNNISANVLAAVGGFSYTALDSTSTFEVAPRTRTPTTPLHNTTGTIDLGTLHKFLAGGVDENSITEYLESKGLERGRAYEHQHCPVHPEIESQRTPVYVGETGIICKACEAKSFSFGSRRAGFFPYSALCGSHDLNEIARMVENFTHWTHAQIVLEARCRLVGNHARLAYEGMLRLRHGDDPRVNSVFSRGEHIIRGMGKWVTCDRYESLSDIRGTLSLLPVVQSIDGKPVVERLDLFDQNIDLSRYGYPSIRPIYGMRIFGEYLGNDGGPISVVLPPADLTEPAKGCLRPRYIPESRRLPIDQVWERIEAVFPRINRNYLLLLIAARGVSEGEVGLPANIIVTGPTATGKTATAMLASSITGDGCTEVQFTADIKKFRQAFMFGNNRGAFVVINELEKYAKQARISPRQGFDIFLNITPSSVSKEMYVGPVPIGKLPVSIITATSIPPDVISDQQLGRRFVYLRLGAQINWVNSLIQSGVRMPERFRSHSIENAEAANALVSYVIDRWFKDKPQSLVEIAESLGFTDLAHCDEVVNDGEGLANLFHEVCKAPESHSSRLKGRGWRVINMDNDETTLADAWRSVCDGVHSYEQFSSSRKVTEADWSIIVNVPLNTRPDILPNHGNHGRGIAIRFRHGSDRGRGEYHVNEELLTCEGERRTINSGER